MRHVETGLGYLIRLAAGLGVASLVALMALTVTTVTFRAVGIAFPGTYVLSELLLIPAVSFALAFAAWDDAHTRVDLLVSRFRKPYKQWSIGTTLLLGTVFWGFVAWAAIEEALRRGRQGEMTPLLDIPVAPFRWLMVTALCLMIAACLFRAGEAMIGRGEDT